MNTVTQGAPTLAQACSLRASRLEQRWTATLGKTVDGETDACLKLKQNELQNQLTRQ